MKLFKWIRFSVESSLYGLENFGVQVGLVSIGGWFAWSVPVFIAEITSSV